MRRASGAIASLTVPQADTEDEKKQAALEVITGKLHDRNKQITGSFDTLGSSIKRFKVDIKDATEAVLTFVYQGIEELGRANRAFAYGGDMNKIFAKTDEEVRGMAEADISRRAGEFGGVAGERVSSSVTGELGRGAGFTEAVSDASKALSARLQGIGELIRLAKLQGKSAAGKGGEQEQAAIAYKDKRITWDQFVQIVQAAEPHRRGESLKAQLEKATTEDRATALKRRVEEGDRAEKEFWADEKRRAERYQSVDEFRLQQWKSQRDRELKVIDDYLLAAAERQKGIDSAKKEVSGGFFGDMLGAGAEIDKAARAAHNM